MKFILVAAVLLTSCQLNSQLNMAGEADEETKARSGDHKVDCIPPGGNICWSFRQKEVDCLGLDGIKRVLAQNRFPGARCSDDFISLYNVDQKITDDEELTRLIAEKVAHCTVVFSVGCDLSGETQESVQAVVDRLQAGKLCLRMLNYVGALELLNNPEVAFYGVRNHPDDLQYVSASLRADKGFIEKCIICNRKNLLDILAHADAEVRNDARFLRCILGQFDIQPSEVMQGAGDNKLRQDPEFVLLMMAVYLDSYREQDKIVEILEHYLQLGLEVGMEESGYKPLDEASFKEVRFSAVEFSQIVIDSLHILKGATPDAQEAIFGQYEERLSGLFEVLLDSQGVDECSVFQGKRITHFMKNMLFWSRLTEQKGSPAERDIVLSFPGFLAYASDQLKSDKEFVIQVVSKHGLALKSVSSDLQNDEAVALAAIRDNPYAAQWVGEELRGSKNFIQNAHNANPDGYWTVKKILG